MVATHLSVGPVARGTEVVGQTFRGTEIGGEQSFRISAGLGALVSVYMKTRHLNGARRVVRLLPDGLTELLIEYLVIICLVETKFAQLFYTHQIVDYRRFLWVQHGRRVKPVSLSQGISHIAGNGHLGIKFNLHMWCQVAKAILTGIVVRQMEQIYTFGWMELVHPAIHYGFGHSDTIGETQYGVDASKISAISEGDLPAMQDLCQRYHVWAGLSEVHLVQTFILLLPSLMFQTESYIPAESYVPIPSCSTYP
jgi:hypothetical protein